MQARIDDIIIKKRLRVKPEELESLVSSIRQVGVLQPILVTPNLELLCGHRRIAACKELGLEQVPIHIIEIADDVHRIDLEYHENIGRMDFKQEEVAAYESERATLLSPTRKLFFIRWFEAFIKFVRRMLRIDKPEIADKHLTAGG